MANNFEEKILKELKKSGVPTEIEVTEILENKNWKVANQLGYLDSDENKWRRIDVRAVRAEDLPHSQTYKRVVMHLYIECKRSEKYPWVFYIRRKEEMPSFPFDLLDLVKETSWPPILVKSFLDRDWWKDCFHYLKIQVVGVISFEPFNKGKSKIFEAANQVVKCVKYHSEKNKKLLSGMKHSVIVLSYPIIIFNGKLYIYKKERSVIPVKYVQYLFSYGEENFLVDVVRLDFLEKYLRILNEEFEALKKNINFLQPSFSI